MIWCQISCAAHREPIGNHRKSIREVSANTVFDLFWILLLDFGSRYAIISSRGQRTYSPDETDRFATRGFLPNDKIAKKQKPIGSLHGCAQAADPGIHGGCIGCVENVQDMFLGRSH